jgi:ferredoxin
MKDARSPDALPRFTVTLPGGRPSFEMAGSGTVLAAALAAGIALGSSCRNGTCRACIARLDSGRVVYDIEWPGLSADEKAAGYFLPCVARPASDLAVRSFGTD